MKSLLVEVESLEQTREFGQALAACLKIGDVVALVGDLGAGKTQLVQTISVALGADPDEVNSPTFVLIQEYDADMLVCHFDAYRLADTDQFLELGADELLGGDNICLIEWADRVMDVLPRLRIEVNISVTGEFQRRIEVTGESDRLVALQTQLATYSNSVLADG